MRERPCPRHPRSWVRARRDTAAPTPRTPNTIPPPPPPEEKRRPPPSWLPASISTSCRDKLRHFRQALRHARVSNAVKATLAPRCCRCSPSSARVSTRRCPRSSSCWRRAGTPTASASQHDQRSVTSRAPTRSACGLFGGRCQAEIEKGRSCRAGQPRCSPHPLRPAWGA